MKKTVTCGILIALALIFSYIESLFPIPVPLPGIKVGLANLVVVFTLYRLGYKYAINVSLIRVLLVGFMFGSLSAILYGLAGAILSLIAMIIVKSYSNLHVVTVSIIGSLAHIIGQLLVAGAVTDYRAIAYYAPYLLIAAFVAGGIIGSVSSILIGRIPIDMN